jgi:hypothetical protein
MLQADRAKVEWNSAKKMWEVRIDVGAEVIKRPIENVPDDTGEAVLKERAIAIALDEGYQLTPAVIDVQARVPA